MTAAGTRIVRIGLWATVVVLALLGLVTAHPPLLVLTGLALLVGGFVGGGMGGGVREVGATAWLQGRAAGAQSVAWTTVVKYAAGAAVGVLAVAGLIFTGGVLSLVVLPALVALGIGLHHHHDRRRPVVADPLPTGAVPAELTNAELARRWRVTYGELTATRDGATLERLRRERERLLDEIERRDPTGFRRWIQSGNWVRGDSAPFLGG